MESRECVALMEELPSFGDDNDNLYFQLELTMPTLETLLTFSFAALLLSISPGPSNLYIMARSMHHGFASGAAAAGGMVVGSFIYVVASALGLAALFEYAPIAYTAIKIAGAAYLIWLGVSYLRASQQAMTVAPVVARRSLSRIFKQSIVVELTNPKTALFFIAFLPQFVNPEQGNATVQFLALGVIYTCIAFICDLFVAAGSGKLGKWLQHHPKFNAYQDKVSGSTLCGIGGYIAYQEVIR
ncbi:MAG: LysE family translocator [Aestuariibacter sp.]